MPQRTMVKKKIFCPAKNRLTPEWKAECDRFFQDHFGTNKTNVDIEKYRTVIRVIFEYGIKPQPGKWLYLGSYEPGHLGKVPRRFVCLREVISILVDHNRVPKEVECILEEELQVFCDRNPDAFCEKKLSKDRGYFLTNIVLKDEVRKSIYYYSNQARDVYSFSPVSVTGQRKHNVLLRMKDRIKKKLIHDFKLT